MVKNPNIPSPKDKNLLDLSLAVFRCLSNLFGSLMHLVTKLCEF